MIDTLGGRTSSDDQAEARPSGVGHSRDGVVIEVASIADRGRPAPASVGGFGPTQRCMNADQRYLMPLDNEMTDQSVVTILNLSPAILREFLSFRSGFFTEVHLMHCQIKSLAMRWGCCIDRQASFLTSRCWLVDRIEGVVALKDTRDRAQELAHDGGYDDLAGLAPLPQPFCKGTKEGVETHSRNPWPVRKVANSGVALLGWSGLAAYRGAWSRSVRTKADCAASWRALLHTL